MSYTQVLSQLQYSQAMEYNTANKENEINMKNQGKVFQNNLDIDRIPYKKMCVYECVCV